MVDEAAVHQVSPLLAPMSKEEARRCFFDFMTKVTQYEELVDAGKMFLVKFRQELEHFRRPMIPMESGAVSQLVKSNYTDRLKSYLEAGCHLQHQSIRNINQLCSREQMGRPSCETHDAEVLCMVVTVAAGHNCNIYIQYNLARKN